MCYSELIHIQCGHARRFGSPSAGSEPRLYCTSARPFAAARHELETGAGRRRLHVGWIEGGRGGTVGSVGLTRSGLGDGCSRRSLLQGPPLPLFPAHTSRTWTLPTGLTVAGRRPSYPSLIRVESLSGLRTLPVLQRRNLPLQSSFKFLSASASLASSSSWVWPLVPSPFVLASSARCFKFVVASRQGFRSESFRSSIWCNHQSLEECSVSRSDPKYSHHSMI